MKRLNCGGWYHVWEFRPITLQDKYWGRYKHYGAKTWIRIAQVHGFEKACEMCSNSQHMSVVNYPWKAESLFRNLMVSKENKKKLMRTIHYRIRKEASKMIT